MLSHEGRCFTFNQSADGFLRAEGIGAVVLQQTKYDQEKHFGMLAGSNCNQDGRSASLTAPSGPAQVLCVQGAQRSAGKVPHEIDISECHGTGTALGDPIEVGSLRRVFTPKGVASRPDAFIF